MEPPPCALSRAVGDALRHLGASAAALISAGPDDGPTVSTRISVAQLRSWMAASVAAINGPAGLGLRGSAPVVGLALPVCSIEESAWVLLIASQPRWVFVPLDVHGPRARLRETLASSSIDGIVTWDASGLTVDGSTTMLLPALDGSPLKLQLHRLSSDTQPLPSWRRDTELQALYVIPTSGTTGQAKGVVGTRVGAFERAKWSRDTLPMEMGRDVVLRATRLTFVDAVAEILGSCLGGAPLLHLQFNSDATSSTSYVDSIVLHSPRAFIKFIGEWHVTRFTVVPSVLRVLLHCISVINEDQTGDGPHQLTDLDMVLVSGEPLPLGVVDEFFRLMPKASLVNLYGSTEVSGDVMWKKLHRPLSKEQRDRWEKHGMPIGDSPGLAIGDSTRIRLASDSNRCTASPHSPCEISVNGGAVAAGYLVDNQIVRPPNRWAGDADGVEWFLMGDICRVIDGELFVCGRKDRQVKIRGNRFQLEEVEQRLRGVMKEEPVLNDVADVIVSTTTFEASTARGLEVSLVAFVLVGEGQREGRARCNHCIFVEIDVAPMRRVFESVMAQFGALYVPSTVVAISASDVPRRPSGKTDVSRLQDMLLHHTCHGAASVCTPEDENELFNSSLTVPLALIRNVLGIPKGLTDAGSREKTWLQLGGNSLQATLLSWEIEQNLKIFIPALEIMRITINEILMRVLSKKRRRKSSGVTGSRETSSRAVQPRRDLTEYAEIRSASPKWVWYSRYNLSSLHHAGMVSKLCADTETLPSTAKIILRLVAQTDLSKCIDASPLIVRRQRDDGGLDSRLDVFIGSHAGRFVCFEIDAVSHLSRELWNRKLDDRIEATATLSAAIGLVFVSTYSGCLYAFDMSSGKVMWKFKAQDMIKSSALVVESLALVIVGSYDRRVYGLDMVSGVIVWKDELPGSVYSTPLFIVSTKQLIVATTTGVVRMLHLRSRDILQVGWESELPAPVFASLRLTRPAINGEAEVLVACADGVVYALNLANGSLVWSFSTLKPIFCTPCVYQFSEHTKGVAAIVGSHDGKLRKISMENGTRMWEADINEPNKSEAIFASPCVAAIDRNPHGSVTVVCAATTTGRIFFFDESTGREIPSFWGTSLDVGEIFSSPVVVENLCFVGTRSNQLLVFRINIQES